MSIRDAWHRSESTKDNIWFGGLVLAAIAAALLVAMVILVLAGSEPGAAFEAMVKGSVGSKASIVTTMNHAGPILVVAIGACIAGRASIVNIGQEGQLLIGATVAVVVGIWFPGPRLVVIPLVLLAGAVGGGLWSGIAALLKQVSGVNEVITTLLLNFLAVSLVSYLVNREWLLQETLPEGAVGSASPQSDPIQWTARLPVLLQGQGFRFHAGFAMAVVLAVIAGFVISRTVHGFRLRMFGHNPRAAQRAGVSRAVYGTGALVVSGAYAGLAGAILLSGVAFRVNPNLSSNYGWEGLLVALVAGFSPVVAIFAALLFAALRAGGGVLAATGVDSSIVGVIQALIVLAVMLPSLYMRRRRRRRQARLVQRSLADQPGEPVSPTVVTEELADVQ
jgi:simple sugar transport system permease protein